MKIEWDSSFHADGRRRSRPKASTVHGWLVKMRGTLIGDEKLRSRGIREMKEARAVRKYKRETKAERRALERRHTGSGSKLFAFGGAKKPGRNRTGITRGSNRSRRHVDGHPLVGYTNQKQQKVVVKYRTSRGGKNVGSRQQHHTSTRRPRGR